MRLLCFFFRPSLVPALPLLRSRHLAGLFGDTLQVTPDLDSTSTGFLLTEPTSKTRIVTHITSIASSSISPTLSVLTTTQLPTVLATTSNLPLSMPTSSPGLPEAPPTSPEEATQWKVIGIGIITVGLIATVILSIIFFDAWWNFLCDLFCGCGKKRRKPQGEENMIPDWETRDWEFKLANEDGHRYPTMSSLADITEGQGKRAIKPVPVQPTDL